MLITRGSMLDIGVLRMEAADVATATHPDQRPSSRRTTTMFDPAATGTLRIGLDRIQRESVWTDGAIEDRTARTTQTRRERGLTSLAAAGLRRLADALSPVPGYDAESASL
ncbi:MAG TPA: hypothetical protein VF119_01865 [Candidatus Limnocylindrales bacterium]